MIRPLDWPIYKTVQMVGVAPIVSIRPYGKKNTVVHMEVVIEDPITRECVRFLPSRPSAYKDAEIGGFALFNRGTRARTFLQKERFLSTYGPVYDEASEIRELVIDRISKLFDPAGSRWRSDVEL